MLSKISHEDLIDTEALFWGRKELSSMLSPEQVKELCDLEILDWLSSLYWGEGIAMNYALKMSNISSNKEKWLEVYVDEHKHQTMLGNWFIENNLVPNPKNKFIDYAFKKVESLHEQMDADEIIDVMYSTQVLYEELFHSLLKTRTKYVRNRDLKAIFYQIFVEESSHLAKARSEIIEYDRQPRKIYETLRSNSKRLFPIELAINILSSENLNRVKAIQESIVLNVIEESISNEHLYQPNQILSKFCKIPGYNCVACSPLRHNGLHIEAKKNVDNNCVEDTYTFAKRYEGFNNVIHGGVVGTVLDEMMCFASILLLDKLPVTSEMTVNFKKPVMSGIAYRVEGRIVEFQGNLAKAEAFIIDSNGKVVASSKGDLFVPTKEQAPKILGQLGSNPIAQSMFL